MWIILTLSIYILSAYTLIKIETLVNKFVTYLVFSNFNLKGAYYLLPLHEDGKLFTAFKANGYLYQYSQILFGITNEVATFQWVIDKFVEEEGLVNTFPCINNGVWMVFLEVVLCCLLTLKEGKRRVSVLCYKINKGLV